MTRIIGALLCWMGLHMWSGQHESHTEVGWIRVRICGRCWVISETRGEVDHRQADREGGER